MTGKYKIVLSELSIGVERLINDQFYLLEMLKQRINSTDIQRKERFLKGEQIVNEKFPSKLF